MLSRDYGNKWYLHGDDRLGRGLIGSFQTTHLQTPQGDLEAINLKNHDWYIRDFKQALGEINNNGQVKYIYQIKKNLKILEDGPRLIPNLQNMGLLPDDTQLSRQRGLPVVISKIVEYVGIEHLQDRFDGYDRERGVLDTICVWPEVVYQYADLVDGLSVRYQDDHPSDTVHADFPPWVIEGLEQYTTNVKPKLSSDIQQWLQEHIELPYAQTRAYRGIEMTFLGSPDMEDIRQQVSSYFNIPVDRLRAGQSVEASPGAPRSWSHTPEVARSHGPNKGGSIRVMLKANVSADDILVDVTLLPDDIQARLYSDHENELIVRATPIQSTLDGVYAMSHIRTTLQQSGYRFEQGVGVIENEGL
jgi:hypothetical protein